MQVKSATNSDTFKTITPGDCEIVMTRLFNAPRALVFEVMSKPEHVRKWWGILDENHSVTECEIDLRVGGKWRYVGKGPQGEVIFYGVYREIDAPGRIVFTEIYAPYPDVESLVTSTLTQEGSKTRITVSATYPSREVRDMVVSSGMEYGAGISYDRLEDVLAELQTRGR